MKISALILLFLFAQVKLRADSLVYKIDAIIQEQHTDFAKKQQFSAGEMSNSGMPNTGISYPEIHYEYKIAALNEQTPIELFYNKTVGEFIYSYAVKRRREFGEILGYASYYFPLFEEILDRYQLPLELKYLAIVESSLNPLAVSKSGAVGLWQLKYNSGKMFDLRIDSYIDERRDPYKSTEAACRYMTYLYNIFQDWQLVIAAYNGGPGEIRNAIIRSGGKTSLADLLEFLPEQTKNYFPAFVAAYYVMTHYADHQIVPQKNLKAFMEVDTVHISSEVSFKQIEHFVGISTDSLRILNPVYRIDIIPNYGSMKLSLPLDKTSTFLFNEDKIYTYQIPQENYFSAIDESLQTKDKKKIEHVVSKGEFFHMIAMKYNCSIESIKAWNNLESDFLYPGQKLIIWVEK